MKSIRTTTVACAMAVACCAALVTSGCQRSDPVASPHADGPGLSADQSYLLGNVAAQRAAVNRRVLARNLAEWLPNQRFVVDGQNVPPETSVVVRGKVESAQGARGFYVPGGPEEDAPAGTEIPFEDPRAQWRLIELTISVDAAVGERTEAREHVGLVVDGPDHERLLRGAASLGSVVLVLSEAGTFRFDEQLRRVEDVGALIGRVDPRGRISFPALGAESSAVVGDLTTWEAIEKEFATQKQPIVTDATGRRVTD